MRKSASVHRSITPEEFFEKFGVYPTLDQDLVEILKRCSEEKDVTEWRNWRENNRDQKINLQTAYLEDLCLKGIDLTCAHFEGAVLRNVDLQEAKLAGVRFENAILTDVKFDRGFVVDSFFEEAFLNSPKFNCAKLNGANFKNADICYPQFKDTNLEAARFEGTCLLFGHLEGADFHTAIVNSQTLISDCTIDKGTDFSFVGLSSARIDPSLRVALETNIRRFEWQKYYKAVSASWQGRLKSWLYEFFWNLSDYGSNTRKIFGAFLKASCFFTFCYVLLYAANPAILKNISHPPLTENPLYWPYCLLWLWDLFCFAVATMVTLGFGGINVAMSGVHEFIRFLGVTTVTLNLFTGYFLLAVLVTRIGILFQSLGPEQESSKPHETKHK